jgi:hypothetical protein
VRKQRQVLSLLQVSAGGGSIEQISGPSCLQVPVSWARHVFFPAQTPEQHCSARLHGSPTLRQPKRFGFGFFSGLLRLRFFFAPTLAGNRDSPNPSPAPVRPRRTSRRDGIAVKARVTRSSMGLIHRLPSRTASVVAAETIRVAAQGSSSRVQPARASSKLCSWGCVFPDVRRDQEPMTTRVDPLAAGASARTRIWR